MDSLLVQGGAVLKGTIGISGAKNAALALMPAALMSDEPLRLTNMPTLADTKQMEVLLAAFGLKISEGGTGVDHWVEFDAREVASTLAPYDIVRKMRASIFTLAPLVARMGTADVSLPGGCAIGSRPVDLYISGLEAMGVQIELDGGYIRARAPQGLKGARIVYPFVSVGATESMMMAACLAKGETELVNAAREPEVVDLANCLVAMGAKIDGIGTETLRIQGVDRLHGAVHPVIADRIEAGTYAMAAAMTGGDVLLERARMSDWAGACAVMEAAGVELSQEENGVRVRRTGSLIGTDAMTEPFPGFATDLQAQFMAMMCIADGASMVTETIFENRFMHVQELARMGANITVHGSSALVRGVKKLKGAPVMASDLRASASLVMAGLVAEGETVVNRIYHLDRGYERIEEKLAGVGAVVKRIKEPGSAEGEKAA